MIRILHVTECYAGGVRRAMLARAAEFPEAEHQLIWTGDESPVEDKCWTSIERMPDSLVGRIRAIRRGIKVLQPDIVHAHSSWAGLYSRCLPIQSPIVYEPHCFKFDDPALSPAKRFLYKQAEKVLARRTWRFGVLSAHEDALVRELEPRAETFFIPNTPSVAVRASTRSFGDIQETPIVSMNGRLVAQKGPDFFVEVVRAVQKRNSAIKFRWIGDGDDQYRALLQRVGVEITGWLDEKELLEALRSTDVYLHTASYEGFPLSVLDAAAQGLPVVLRSIPAFEGLPFLASGNVDSLASHVLDLLSDEKVFHSAAKANQIVLAKMNKAALAHSLRALYLND